MPLIYELSIFKFSTEVNFKSLIPYFTVLIAFLLVSKFPTFSFKKISISPKTTIFILLGIGLVFISLLFYTFETLLIFGFILFIFDTNKFFHV